MAASVSTPVSGAVVGFAFVTPRGQRFEADNLKEVFDQAKEMGQDSGELYAVIQPEGQHEYTEEQRISAKKGDKFVKLTCERCRKTEWVPLRSGAPIAHRTYQCESCGCLS